jgi:hypothetical protein
VQPRNKLSRAGHTDPIAEEVAPDTPSNAGQSQELDLSRTEKKAGERMKVKLEGEEIKEDTLKLTEETDKSTLPLPAFL